MACKHDFVRVSSKWITEKFGLWHRRCLSVSSPGLLYYKQVYTVVRRERDHNWNKPVSTVDDRAWCPNTVLSSHQSEHTLFATTQVKIQARYRCPSTGSELEFCCFNVGTSSLLHTFFWQFRGYPVLWMPETTALLMFQNGVWQCEKEEIYTVGYIIYRFSQS